MIYSTASLALSLRWGIVKIAGSTQCPSRDQQRRKDKVMPRTDAGTYTPESLTTIATAIQSIVTRLTRTAEAMREKKVSSLEIKNQAALKTAITAVRGFGMAAEEALEEWVFDQSLLKESADPVEVPAKVRPGRKPKKESDAAEEEHASDEPRG
jgi:hypothetical protein